MAVAVKYICPKCGRRFVDWGAEKLNFKCPTEECAEETLVLLGSESADLEDKPKLKRVRKAKVAPDISGADMDIAGIDDAFIDSMDADDMDVDDDEEEDDDEDIPKPVVVRADVVEDLDLDEDKDAVIDDEEAEEDDDSAFVDALDIDDGDIALDKD